MTARPQFADVYKQFLGEVGLTFPELEKATDKTLKNTGFQEFTKTVAPILHQIAARDNSIFTDAGIEIAPGVVMTKKLWKEGGKSTQKAIWDFLSSLVLLASYEKRGSSNAVGEEEFAAMFDISGAEADLKKMFKDLGDQFSSQSFSSFFEGIKEAAESLKEKFGEAMGISGEGIPMPKIPEKLFKGHIARIAEELAREFKPEDFGLDPSMLESTDTGAIFEYLQQIFTKNPDMLMRGAKKIAFRIQEKLKRGEVSREQLIAEAESLMEEFKNNDIFKEVFEQLNAGLRGDFGMGGGSGEPSARRKEVQERLRKKLAAKQGGKKK